MEGKKFNILPSRGPPGPPAPGPARGPRTTSPLVLPCGVPIHLSMWGVVGYVGGPLNVWWTHFFWKVPHMKKLILRDMEK